MGDTVECVRPKCDEVYDPEQTGGSCPKCQTPHPDVPDVGTDDPDPDPDPEVPCPDPNCSGTIPEGGDFCSNCGTERGAEIDTDDEDEDEGAGDGEDKSDSLTCPNGHEVDDDDDFCPDCGEAIPDDAGEEGGDEGPPTCPNGHEVDPDADFCPSCGEPITDEDEDEGPPTCPNGHEVDEGVDFCPECGEPVDGPGGDDDTGGSSAGPSVTLEVGSQTYDVIEDGQITVDDDEKSADVFGTDARRAAQAEGVDASDARQIHRDYLSFRVDGDDCYVTNEGQNPTKYNGDNFPQNEERQLNDGDKIDLGAGVITAVVRMGN